ncbi:MAG: CsiV family protein, partial [Gammaproteobacteria bacterium]|nr:CsiV family protein [Gammaproteobacteria bacterium]
GRPPPAIEPTLEPHPLLDWLNAARRFETRLRADSYRTAARGTILRREANRIRNAPQLRLLWHGRWTQPVPPRSAPEPLLIQAGRRNDGVHELEGTVDITLGRYLHFHAHLWWVSHRKALNAEGAPPSSIPNGTESGSHPHFPEGAEYMVLRESRVMRSGTLHYLDHPVLGVLVRADPVTAPGWLADASAAFESEQGGD